MHRVNGLAPGLYALARDAAKLDALREIMRPDFLWQRPPSCPPELSLYLLREGDCRALAASVFTVGGHVEDVGLTTLPPYTWQP